MKILITGATGFLGKNVAAQLRNMGYQDIYAYTRESTMEDLELYTKECEFVFHFAGVNRTTNTEDFKIDNSGLTESLVRLLQTNGNKAPILFSSSIQVNNNSPYAESKRFSEMLLHSHSEINKSSVLIYRLPNLFGKWSKPNYNSVVSTFCYNIARGKPIHIHDEERIVTLNYIDDVVGEFISALNYIKDEKCDYYVVPKTYRISLQKLADKIKKFKRNRETLIMPSLASRFDRALYATYLSYIENDKFSYQLKKQTDERGWLAEFIKSESMGQFFISKTGKGITRGNHWHHTKVEKFLVIKGEAIIKFRQVGIDQYIEYKVNGEKPEVVDVPAGYAHSIENIGEDELITLFWASEIFNPEKTDTYYMEV